MSAHESGDRLLLSGDRLLLGGAARPHPARLRAVGRRLVGPEGTPVFLVGLDGFTTLQDLLVGNGKAETLLAYAQTVGADFLRVFGMINDPNFTRFIPSEYPAYWDGLHDLAVRCRDAGLYLYFTVLADCQNAPLWADGTMITQAETVLADVADSVILSGGNEYVKNGFDPRRLPRPQTILAAAASCGGGVRPCHDPIWDFVIWEASRSNQWARTYKDIRDQFQGDNANPQDPTGPDAYAFPCPILEDETIGHGDVAELGRTNADPVATFTYFAGAKMMGASGVCVHQRSGIFGGVPVPGGPEDQCVRVAITAARLPLGAYAFADYQRGTGPTEAPNPRLPVLHADREPNPDIGYPGTEAGSWRTHAMGDGTTYEVVAPGAGPAYQMQAAPGWRIADQWGYPGAPLNVARVTRA